MKRFLGILFLGILWCNISFAVMPPIYDSGINDGTAKQQFFANKNLDPIEGIWEGDLNGGEWRYRQAIYKNGSRYKCVVTMNQGNRHQVGQELCNIRFVKKVIAQGGQEQWWYEGDIYALSWGKCCKLKRKEFIVFNDGGQKYLKVKGYGDYWSIPLDTIRTAKVNNNSTSSSSTADKITQSKQICRDLGFKTNTEKFADCALKMMSIQFEATNKVASSSGGTTQEIIVKHKQDYDVFDAMLDMSNALLSNNSSSSSSSSSSGNTGTRCVIGKTHAWGHTVMNCN